MMNKIPKRFPTKIADRSLAASYCHFRPMIQLEMVFDYFLDEQRLEKSLALLMDAEPILGCRFSPGLIRSFWERVDRNDFKIFTLTRNMDEYEIFKNKCVDFFSEPQISACLYRSDTADCLILKISHLITDASGVKDIAALLSTIYNRLEHEPDFVPPVNLDDCRSFLQITKHIPWYGYPRILFNFLTETWTGSHPYRNHSVPITATAKTAGAYITKHIEKAEVSNLVQYAEKHNATINDIMLAAILCSLSKIGEKRVDHAFRIGITVDLRRYLPEKKASSISNFSSIEIITYGKAIEKDFGSTLKRVVKILRKRKSSWLGLSAFVSINLFIWPLPFSILKRITQKGWEYRYDTPNSSDLFTNMGGILADEVDFGGVPAHAWLLPPGCDLPICFFGCSGYNGALSLSAYTSTDGENAVVVSHFLELIVSELPLKN